MNTIQVKVFVTFEGFKMLKKVLDGHTPLKGSIFVQTEQDKHYFIELTVPAEIIVDYGIDKLKLSLTGLQYMIDKNVFAGG